MIERADVDGTRLMLLDRPGRRAVVDDHVIARCQGAVVQSRIRDLVPGRTPFDLEHACVHGLLGVADGRSRRTELPAYFDSDRASNGPTEAMNLLVEKIRRVGHGFRNFTNYRLRLRLACGVDWQTPHTPRVRAAVHA